MHKFVSTSLFLLIAAVSQAQTNSGAEAFFRSSQKFYVTVAVIFLILSILIAFLFYLERKASRIQQRIESFTKK